MMGGNLSVSHVVLCARTFPEFYLALCLLSGYELLPPWAPQPESFTGGHGPYIPGRSSSWPSLEAITLC